jgi:hypothetical protein
MFSSVFWLDGRSEDWLRQSLAGCANRIPEGQIPDRSRNLVLNNEEDLNIVVADALDWLARLDNVDLLLVFDNVDQDYEQDSETGAYDVRRYLPSDHGSVLITTRLSRLAQLGDSKRLKKVDKELGKAIFKQWYRPELGKPLAIYEFSMKLIGCSCGRGRQRAAWVTRWPPTCAGTGCLVSPQDGARHDVVCSALQAAMGRFDEVRRRIQLPASGLRAAKCQDDVDDIV